MSTQESLWDALVHDDVEAVRDACAAGANVNSFDADGATPLFNAGRHVFVQPAEQKHVSGLTG